MNMIYLTCALIGGTIVVCQFVMTLLGLGDTLDAPDGDFGGDVGHIDVGHGDVGHGDVGHGDVGHGDVGHGDLGQSDLGHVDAASGHSTGSTGHGSYSTWLFSVLSFRAVVAGLTFFGLTGMAAEQAGQSPMVAMLLAMAAAAAAVYAIHRLMQGLYRMRSDGTTQIRRAVGEPGTVYLRIPGERQGTGKVHLILQNRTVECAAVTSHEALPTGAKILVVNVLDHDTVEVELAPEPAREAHV